MLLFCSSKIVMNLPTVLSKFILLNSRVYLFSRIFESEQAGKHMVRLQTVMWTFCKIFLKLQIVLLRFHRVEHLTFENLYPKQAKSMRNVLRVLQQVHVSSALKSGIENGGPNFFLKCTNSVVLRKKVVFVFSNFPTKSHKTPC